MIYFTVTVYFSNSHLSFLIFWQNKMATTDSVNWVPICTCPLLVLGWNGRYSGMCSGGAWATWLRTCWILSPVAVKERNSMSAVRQIVGALAHIAKKEISGIWDVQTGTKGAQWNLWGSDITDCHPQGCNILWTLVAPMTPGKINMCPHITPKSEPHLPESAIPVFFPPHL